MDIRFKVTHVNEGPAPFDVFARNDDESVEIRIRFSEEDPMVEEGVEISVSYTPIDKTDAEG